MGKMVTIFLKNTFRDTSARIVFCSRVFEWLLQTTINMMKHFDHFILPFFIKYKLENVLNYNEILPEINSILVGIPSQPKSLPP